MERNKIILERLLDLGGFATKNNFYSTSAGTVLGALVHTRQAFAELEKMKLIQPLSTITGVRNLCREQFFAITKLGAKHVDREADYKWKGSPKSPYNVMHESMVRDVGLSFLRTYPDYTIDISYNECFNGLRPDLVVRMRNKYSLKQSIFFIEVERKKSADRVYNEKLMKYEDVLAKLNFNEFNLNAPVKVLVVYANLDYNPFGRPQEYDLPKVTDEINKLNIQFKHLIKLSSELPENRYRFIPFHKFHRLNQSIWITPNGCKTGLC